MPDVVLRIRAETGQFRREAKRVDRQVRTIQSRLGSLGRDFARAGLFQLSGRFSALSVLLTSVNFGFGALAVSISAYVAAMVRARDAIKNVENALRSADISSTGVSARVGEIARAAVDARAEFGVMAQLSARILQNVRALTFSDALSAAVTMSKAFQLAGASVQEAQGATRQFIQGLASGTLRGQELVSVLEQAPQIAQLIADYMGVARGELRKLAEQGLITNDIVLPAMLEGARKINDAYAEIETTFASSWTVFQTGMTQAFNYLAQQKGGLTDSFATLFESAGRFLTEATTKNLPRDLELAGIEVANASAELIRASRALKELEAIRDGGVGSGFAAGPRPGGGTRLGEAQLQVQLAQQRHAEALARQKTLIAEQRNLDEADRLRVREQAALKEELARATRLAEAAALSEKQQADALELAERVTKGLVAFADEAAEAQRQYESDVQQAQLAAAAGRGDFEVAELGARKRRDATLKRLNERDARAVREQQRQADRLLEGSARITAELADLEAGDDAFARIRLKYTRAFDELAQRIEDGLDPVQAAIDKENLDRSQSIELQRAQAEAAEELAIARKRELDGLWDTVAQLDPMLGLQERYAEQIAALRRLFAEGEIDEATLNRLSDAAKADFEDAVRRLERPVDGFIDGITDTLTDALARGADSSDIGKIFAVKMLANILKAINAGDPLTLGNILSFHEGGVVPGPAGSERLAVLEAGERVTPAGEGGGNLTVNMGDSVMIGDVNRAMQQAVAYNAEQFAVRIAPWLAKMGFVRGG